MIFTVTRSVTRPDGLVIEDSACLELPSTYGCVDQEDLNVAAQQVTASLFAGLALVNLPPSEKS